MNICNIGPVLKMKHNQVKSREKSLEHFICGHYKEDRLIQGKEIEILHTELPTPEEL